MHNLTEKASLAEHKSLNTLSFMVNLEKLKFAGNMECEVL